MVKIMTNLGHTTVEASDGQEAVETVKISINELHQFDVILMDNQMPGMLGTTATRIIRDELRYEGLVLGVTGNAMEDDIADFLAHGADEVVVKPLTREKFVELWEQHSSSV